MLNDIRPLDLLNQRNGCPVNIEQTEIPAFKLISPPKFGDHRGFFSETYSKAGFAANGLDLDFCQDNHSYSATPGTLRGLHFQLPPVAQDKLVRVTQGAILDVAVDIRHGSPTFGQWISRVVSAAAWNQILVPAGFAHGFCTIQPNTEVQYKVTAPYTPEQERGIAWNDPDLAIDWQLGGNQPTLSGKDTDYPTLAASPVHFFYDAG